MSNEELMAALQYALQVIDNVSARASKMAASVPAAALGENGLPNGAEAAARMAHAADLRGLAVLGPSNTAALRSIVAGEPATPWFDPMADIRARLQRSA